VKRTPLKRTGFLRSKKPESHKEEKITLAFPRPSQMKKEQPVVKVMKDGREVCNLLTKAGKDEYLSRIRQMWERQGKQCCLKDKVEGCPGRLTIADATFEHQDGRGNGGGHRDDRILRPDPKTGEMKPYNGAAHWVCNGKKGSTRIDYHEVP